MSPPPGKLPQVDLGLHESLVTGGLAARLAALPGLDTEIERVDDADAPHVLARHVYQVLQRELEATKDPARRLVLVNGILQMLEDAATEVSDPARQLLRLVEPARPGLVPYADVRPATPLSEAALLTNAKGEPSLGAELRAEIDTADEVDLLCAFVKWHGLRLLEPELGRLTERRSPFRVITTTYMGATERAALDRLVREFGAEVRIQYDAQRTRLHAKAWMFRRATRFDTAYVGSSNLSRAALLDGVEWNVRLSRVGTPSLLEKFRATFDTYWNDASFEAYDPARDRDRLDDAIAEASGRSQHDRVTISLSGLDVRPYAYQSQMLEAIEVERTVHGRHRNLVVAATGTGKTVVAALDYRGLCGADANGRPSLLFVAHRKEILQQSLRTYREVLVDANFGELYVGGSRPERWKHVFASVQSLTSYGVENIPPDAYEVVVIDEFHHAEARTYLGIIEHLAPQELLGLTATPERADGTDVRSFFDGRIAAELRLWDALGADLLCPFHYFAVSDGTDLRSIGWTRGRYDEAALSNVFTGNTARAGIVLKQLRDKVIDVAAMRGLGFCVSVAHAEFMAATFRDAGIPALAVSGDTPAHAREQALQDLKDRRVNVLFAADLFNEGLDLPEVDTVLFIRPPRARRSSSSSSAAGCGVRLPSRCSPCSTSSGTIARSSGSTPSCGRSPVTPAVGYAERLSVASHSCRPAARSSWTSRHRPWSWRTSAARSPIVGHRSSLSCAPTATRTCAPSSARPTSGSPTSCGRARSRGRSYVAMLGSPHRREPVTSSTCSSGYGPSPTSMMRPAHASTVVCSPTTPRRTTRSRRLSVGSRRCSCPGCGQTVGASTHQRMASPHYAMSAPPERSCWPSSTSLSTRPDT